jgi:hypothetical protein
MSNLKWQYCETEWDEKNTTTIWHNYPKEVGHYRIMVYGDREIDDMGGVIYDYPDYETWAEVTDVDDGNGKVWGSGIHDEEWGEVVFAWYGPIQIPERGVGG